MYCTSCGSQNPEGAKFCFRCGNGIFDGTQKPDHRPNLQPASTVRPVTAPTVDAGTKTTHMRSARAAFVWLSLSVELASLLGLEVLALFWLARMIASGNPQFESHLTGDGGILIGLVFLPIGLSWSWKRLQVSEPESEARFRKKHRRLRRAAIGFAILCGAAAVAIGASTGNCDASVSVFGADVEHVQQLMQAIGNARIGTDGTIAGYVQMYESIEPKVAEARSVMSRLRTETPGCGDFKAKAGRFELILEHLDQQLALISQEIETAKSINSLPVSERESHWQSQLVPLIDKEASVEREAQALSR